MLGKSGLIVEVWPKDGFYDKRDLQAVCEHSDREADIADIFEHSGDERLRHALYALLFHRGAR